MSRRGETFPNYKPSKYALVARAAIPRNAGCFHCEWTWYGAAGRDKALEHRQIDGHHTWVECKPASETAP